MTNIRSTGAPPSPLPSTEQSVALAAEGLIALLNSPPKSAPLAQTSSSNEAPAPNSPGTADFRQALAAGRSTQRNLLQSMRSGEELRHKVKVPERLTSAGGSHGTTSAHPSTSMSTHQLGRRLAIHELLAPATTGNQSKGPPSESDSKLEDLRGTAGTMNAQDAVRSSSPTGSRMATRLQKDFQTSQGRHAGEAPPPAAFEIGKGKGKVPDRRTPAESYGADNERRSTSNPLEGLIPEQHSIDSAPIAGQETTAAGAAPSEQTHPYMLITPRREVVTMLGASVSLSDIYHRFVDVAPSNAKITPTYLNAFENFLNEKGVTKTKALSNFHYFNSQVNEFLHEKHPESSTTKGRLITILRKFGAEIFTLPSQAKLDEIASQLDESSTGISMLRDAAARLDGLVASMSLAGSLYEGEHARERFLNTKYSLARTMAAQEETLSYTQVIMLLHHLRRIVYELPLDNTLSDILNKTRASASASARKAYKAPGIRVVTTLAEIAFIKGISEEEMIFALREWKNANTHLLVNSELKGKKKDKADQYNGQLSDRQKEVFNIISTALDEYAPGLNSYLNMNPLSNYLANKAPREQEPAAPSGSGNAS